MPLLGKAEANLSRPRLSHCSRPGSRPGESTVDFYCLSTVSWTTRAPECPGPGPGARGHCRPSPQPLCLQGLKAAQLAGANAGGLTHQDPARRGPSSRVRLPPQPRWFPVTCLMPGCWIWRQQPCPWETTWTGGQESSSGQSTPLWRCRGHLIWGQGVGQVMQRCGLR